MNKLSYKFRRILQWPNWLGVLVLVAILIVILRSCLSPFFLDEELSNTEKSRLIITRMGALGTCCMVWLALMMTYWRRFIERPELAMEVSRDLPLLLKASTDELSDGKSRGVEICGKVFNTSEVIAADSQVIVLDIDNRCVV